MPKRKIHLHSALKPLTLELNLIKLFQEREPLKGTPNVKTMVWEV